DAMRRAAAVRVAVRRAHAGHVRRARAERAAMARGSKAVRTAAAEAVGVRVGLSRPLRNQRKDQTDEAGHDVFHDLSDLRHWWDAGVFVFDGGLGPAAVSGCG